MCRYPLACLAGLLAAATAAGQPNFDAPKAVEIDAATRGAIEAKLKQLQAALAALPAKLDPSIHADVAVYAKAGEWVLRHGEFFAKESPTHALAVLDAGLARAKAAADGKAPWRGVRGKPIVRGYRSQVDDSVQPFSVTLPEGYGDAGKKWRLDIVLHGRDQTLTEVKFLRAKEASRGGSRNPWVVLEPYGRGNNAYRWAGETDVQESVQWFARTARIGNETPIDFEKIVLRGFSMGGAGTWHLGLHHPFAQAAIGPGAGFTTTRGYVKNLPAKLPDYQEKCLSIYDAVAYAENAFNVPVIAYSGANDPQKAAADNIEKALAGFAGQVRFTHLVAPGLEHKQPPEWVAKQDAAFAEHLAKGRPFPERVRFVTHTTRYADYGHGFIEAMDELYAKAVVDSTWTKEKLDIKTTNVRAIRLAPVEVPVPAAITIDGQPVTRLKERLGYLVKTAGRWAAVADLTFPGDRAKKWSPVQPLQGPIDDAFMSHFAVVRPAADGAWHPQPAVAANARLARFGYEWEKYFRGTLPTLAADKVDNRSLNMTNLVLFGDPGNNPTLAEVVKKLPITWTKDTLLVNGVSYDPKTHLPVLIYPNPLNPSCYVVINSGHTFGEADLKGTNALLYPRLGDWAVLKLTGDPKSPTAVAAAGLFDKDWKFQP